MIDAVVNTLQDYQAKAKINSEPEAVINATVTTTNSKTTKAQEVESQAKAVNDKDLVENKVLNKDEEKVKQKTVQELEKEKMENEKEVEKLSKEISSLTHSFGLSFAMEKDLNKTVVSVMDSKTDELIRQIPSEEYLKLAKHIKEICKEQNGKLTSKDLQGLLVDNEI